MCFSDRFTFIRNYSSNTICPCTKKVDLSQHSNFGRIVVFFGCACVMLGGTWSKKICFRYYRSRFQDHKSRFGPKTAFALEIRQKSMSAKLYISSVQGTCPENNSDEINDLWGRREGIDEKKSGVL